MGRAVTIQDRAEEIFRAAETEMLAPELDMRRMRQAFMVACVNNPEILECDRRSLISALLKSASDGILCDGRTGALVPFFSRKENKKLVAYIPMVQGIMNRMRDLGEVLSITSSIVYGSDHFFLNEADPEATEHHATVKFGEPRGEMVGAYAIFRDNNKRVIHREVMSKDLILRAKAASGMKSSMIWDGWPEEMWRKTVIRRGSKYVPLSDRMRKIIEREDEYAELEGATEQPRTSIAQRLKGQTTTEGFARANHLDPDRPKHLTKRSRDADDAVVEKDKEPKGKSAAPDKSKLVSAFLVALKGCETQEDAKMALSHARKGFGDLPDNLQEDVDKAMDDALSRLPSDAPADDPDDADDKRSDENIL